MSCEKLAVWMLWYNMEKLLGSTCTTNACLGTGWIYAGVAIQLHCYIAFFPQQQKLMLCFLPSLSCSTFKAGRWISEDVPLFGC